MTLEGCIVRISDLIGYLGRDIEDAIKLGVLDIKQVPTSITEVLGNTNSDIVNTIILDIIDNSFGKPYIKLSDKKQIIPSKIKGNIPAMEMKFHLFLIITVFLILEMGI